MICSFCNKETKEYKVQRITDIELLYLCPLCAKKKLPEKEQFNKG